MVAIGLDVSLRSPGVAVVDDAGDLVFAASLTIGDDVQGAQRLARLRHRVGCTVEPLARVAHCAAIEGPSLGSAHREFDLGEASGAIKAWCVERYLIDPVVVPPALLKKFAVGDPQADKAEVVRYVVSRSGREVDGDDAADAAVLAWIAHALAHPRRPATRAQAEVLKALRAPPPKRRRARSPKTPNF